MRSGWGTCPTPATSARPGRRRSRMSLMPSAVWGRLHERSLGMDTTTGHWEMMGIVTERPFPTYPDGFPAEIIDEFAAATGRGVIGNVAASGTEIIERLGAEHERTGTWIVYKIGRASCRERV